MNEYINKRYGAKELEDELKSLIQKYNKLKDTYLIVYSSAIGKPIPDLSLSMDDYYIIFDVLRNIEDKKIDFYIETPGGSGEAAEEIVRFLRSKFDDISFVVSGEAKSAGTLIVLSGDEIYMTESGALGPIDAQIKIGRSFISAFDYVEWVTEKRNEAEKTGKLNPFDATMVAQISPGELSGVQHSLSFAKDLVVEWLQNYKFKNWNRTETRNVEVTKEMKTQRANEIVGDLINHGKWRSHGRSLKISDLHEIGLKIHRIDDNKDLSEIVYRIQTVIRMLYNSTSSYKIFATKDNKLFKQAVQAGVTKKIPKTQQQKVIDVVDLDVKCPKCGNKYELYAKFIPNKKIDEELKSKGKVPFPSNNKITCDCGFQIDLTGIRNEIETKVGRKFQF